MQKRLLFKIGYVCKIPWGGEGGGEYDHLADSLVGENFLKVAKDFNNVRIDEHCKKCCELGLKIIVIKNKRKTKKKKKKKKTESEKRMCFVNMLVQINTTVWILMSWA